MTTSVCGISTKPGFTLIEIVIVLGVMALLMTVAITQLRPGASPMTRFVDDMQRIVKTAQLASLQTHKTHRIILHLNEQRMYIEQADDTRGAIQDDKQEFIAAPSPWDVTATIPDVITFIAVYVNGVDELAGGTTKRIWIYCYPSGMIQDTKIVIENTETQMQTVLTMNPITAEVLRDEAAQE